MVGLVEIVTDDLGVDLGEVSGSRPAMEVFQDDLFHCFGCFAHFYDLRGF